MNLDKIIYSINLQDVQNVAEQEFARSLTNEELSIVEQKIAENDYFGWYESVLVAIQDSATKEE